jgi:hypothetical protein
MISIYTEYFRELAEERRLYCLRIEGIVEEVTEEA